jgi:metal-responsive CopG/Arc/MetJ family transcriptional regulator
MSEFRTSLQLPQPLLARLDEYWHSERLESRNDAIRELLAYALEQKLAKPAKEKAR